MNCIKCHQPTDAEWKTLCRMCWKKQPPEEMKITYRDIETIRKNGATRWKVVRKIQQRGFENTLKDLSLPSDLKLEWRNLHTGTEELLKNIIWRPYATRERSADEAIPFVLEHWEPNIGINPIKAAAEKITKEEVYQTVVRHFSYYKKWKNHDFKSTYRSIRKGMEGGSFVYGGSINVGGYLAGKNIGSDKILVSWDSGKHFIFTVQQVLEDVLSEKQNGQLGLF